MTISPWTMYWITRLDSICVALTIIYIVSALASAIAVFSWLTDASIGDRTDPTVKMYLRYTLTTFAIAFAIGCFVPSSKEMAAILVIPKIANNAKVQAMPEKLLDLADQWIKALGPKEKAQ